MPVSCNRWCSQRQLVREIDALGGEMGKCIDRTGIQFKMLNRSKGPAVHSHGQQAANRVLYQSDMKRLRNYRKLYLKQGEVGEILCQRMKLWG
jgi:tRNA uridine 5-carboxymethylaminomethyl modification enzyme